MIYGYIRVSTDKQSVTNQEFEILQYASTNRFIVDELVKETVSGTRSAKERMLGQLLEKATKGDTIIVTELSRLGRSLMEVMRVLGMCLEEGVVIHSLKERFVLEDGLQSKVLAFAFSLAAEVERQLISQRTKEALARKKSEGQTLGRPKGSTNKHSVLDGKEDEIMKLHEKKVPTATIARIIGVNRATVGNFLTKKRVPQK